jgi:hypothetical protein
MNEPTVNQPAMQQRREPTKEEERAGFAIMVLQTIHVSETDDELEVLGLRDDAAKVVRAFLASKAPDAAVEDAWRKAAATK